MTENIYKVDKRLSRMSFSKAALTYDAASVLQHEVANRLVSRMEYIRLQPFNILDVGTGTGYCLYELQKRYGNSQCIALDISESMLNVARSKQGWIKRLLNPAQFISADAENLPLADNSVDLVFSNLTIQWCLNLDKVFEECRRVLRPGGLLMFSTLGPDTLKELRESWKSVDGYTHVNAFMDMHDVGDALMRSRFSDPVMDMENITMTYQDVFSLMRDIKNIGAHNVTQGRARGLTGKGRMRAMQGAYERYRENDLLPASYEVIYGHAWMPESASEPGSQRVQFQSKVKG